jgi:sugar/nucleoside kinase (ribokinase family)
MRKEFEHARKAVRFLDLKIYRDIQESFDQETVTYSMEQATVVKMNLDAAHYLAELFEIPNPSLPDFCAELIDEWGLDCCVVTLGRYGLFGAGKNGRQVYCPGYEVATPMPGEGGSACAAGFIHKYLRRHSLNECCRQGNLLGAMAVAHSDPMQPITPQIVQGFLERNQPSVIEPQLKPYQS